MLAIIIIIVNIIIASATAYVTILLPSATYGIYISAPLSIYMPAPLSKYMPAPLSKYMPAPLTLAMP